MKKIFFKSMLLLCALIVGSGVVWGDAITTASLPFPTPQFSENFNGLSATSATATVNASNLTAYGIFNKMYNNNTGNTYAIASNATFGSNVLSLTAGSGSPLIASITGQTFGTKGAFSFKMLKTDKCYIGLYGADSNNASSKNDNAVYLANNGSGVLTFAELSGTSTNWVSIGSYSTTIIEVCVVYNTTNGAATYGNSIALGAKKAHIYVNGTCVMDGSSPKNFSIPVTTLSTFRVLPQASSGNKATIDDVKIYNSLPVKASPSLSVSPSSIDLTYGETASFTVSQSGDGEITVTSKNTSVATVVQDGVNANQYNVTYAGDGDTEITVSVAETESYAAESKKVTVSALDIRDEAGISYSTSSVNVLRSANTYKQTLTNPNSLSVSYKSSDTDIATVASDGTVTFVATGEVTITASFNGDEDYKSGSASYTLTITNKYVASLVFADDAIEKLTTDVPFTNEIATDPDPIDVVYSSSNTEVATINASTGEVTITGAGTATITATIDDDDYEATEFTYTLTVNKATPTLSFTNSIVNAELSTGTSKQVVTTSPSGLAVTYASTNISVATVASDGTVTLLKPGKSIISAIFAGNDTYEAASASYTLNVNAAYATLPFSFNNGSSSIASTKGLTQSGLGSDYSATNSKLKFDGTGDYVVLQIGEIPGALSFNLANNSFSGGTFTVQTSSDGSVYSDHVAYTTNLTTQSYLINDLGEDVRFIKWIYTKKDNGNVGLGNIKLDPKYVEGRISSLGWSTLSSTKDLDFTGITAINAYMVTGVSGSVLTLTKVTGTVPANTGLLISGEVNATVNIPVFANSSTDVSANLLKPGNDASVAYNANSGYNYVLAADGDEAVFKRIVEGASAVVPKGKAYLSLTANPNPNPDAPSIIRFVEEENNATSIEVIGSDDKAIKFFENGQIYILREGVVYDALGRKVR